MWARAARARAAPAVRALAPQRRGAVGVRGPDVHRGEAPGVGFGASDPVLLGQLLPVLVTLVTQAG